MFCDSSPPYKIWKQKWLTTQGLRPSVKFILKISGCSVICRATMTRFDTHNGWWYKACPSCYKQLRTISHTDRLVCPKHNTKDQAPFPWFSVGLILEDASDETNAMIIVKAAEQLFGISCYHLVVEKGFTRQEEFQDAILRVRGHYKLYESNC
ncbi:unnamed protein product [Prunus brigantina]